MKRVSHLMFLLFLSAIALNGIAGNTQGSQKAVKENPKDAKEIKDINEFLNRSATDHSVRLAPETLKRLAGAQVVLQSFISICQKEIAEYPTIKLSDGCVSALKKDFDEEISLAQIGLGKNRKKITFDYRHIFDSEVDITGKATVFHMGHRDVADQLFQNEAVKMKCVKRGPAGSYRVTWSDKNIIHTFFPDNWQPNKTMAKIKEALMNIVEICDQAFRSKYAVIGKTKEGLKIKIVFHADKKGNPTGKVRSAYPIID